MDAEAQSDPCEETIDPFAKSQFKQILTNYGHVTYAATSDTTVKTLVLGKKVSNTSSTQSLFELTEFVRLQ